MYDAIPECWKRLTVEKWHQVLCNIDEIYKNLPSNEIVRTKQNVICVAKFVHLQEVFKLCSCYFYVKKDTFIIENMEEEQSHKK